MQQVQYINGTLYGALDTAFVPTGEFFPLAAAAWFKVRPHLQGQTIGSATLTAQGYLFSDSNFLLYPAIQADTNGAAAMVFTISGPTLFPSAAYAMLPAGHANFGTIHIAGPGTGPYSPQSTAGATIPGPSSPQMATVSGWRPNTSRPWRARPPTACKTGAPV